MSAAFAYQPRWEVTLARSATKQDVREGERELSWREVLMLKAAAQADCLTFRAVEASNVRTGTIRALRIFGYLTQHPLGWEITDEGRERARRLP